MEPAKQAAADARNLAAGVRARESARAPVKVALQAR
jgi:hypothetical protein